ncbi:hypothetical protein ILUMI_19486 [Ignelater luminosus]|uniref:Carboxylic ester hydrolase n=1 Tax=Ignelater luminosus TaxID=2038154 RepID=A0A8K0CMC0_IGNLU|nr:hypothetical protein ILUMI_19486 [Ignelater luminosus]
MFIILRLLIGCLLISNIHLSHINNKNPIVTTSLGKVKGAILTTLLGKPIYSFRGIRYAKPPVDELRFKPPVPVEKWSDVYDATKDGPLCPQPVGINEVVSEDCLILNVYTTKLPQGENNPKRPVIVHLHPGGFYAGTSSSRWRGPDYLLDQHIVLVTLNYRLGSLGFVSTGDELAPGNNGLKDQVIALRWVRDNIAPFGGDPNLVTVFGYSAGSASMHFHMVSPMSRGLFHRAITMSSSALGKYPIRSHQFDLAQKQARLLNCPDDTSANIINCLKTKSAEEIGNSLPGFAEFRFDPILIWVPVVEPDFGQERFLTKSAVESVLKGDFVKVPVMGGISEFEFSGPAFGVIGNTTLLKQMDEDFERVAPIAFIYERNTENSKHISRELRKFYLGDRPLDNSSLTGLTKLYADAITGFNVNRGIKLIARKNDKPVYYYCFTFRGRYSHFYLPGTQTPYGPVHHDELFYLFYISPLASRFNVTSPEYAMVKKLTTLFSNFAYTGNPIPESNEALDNVNWIPFSNQNKEYLDIGQKLAMKSNLYEDRYAKWDELFPVPTVSQ